jgi:phosphoketolase
VEAFAGMSAWKLVSKQATWAMFGRNDCNAWIAAKERGLCRGGKFGQCLERRLGGRMEDDGFPERGTAVDDPVIFAYHGYPLLIHRLTYRRMNHENLHVRGYKEDGTTTTPFDMVMLNDLDRFRLVIDVLDRVPGLEPRTARLRQEMVDARLDARRYGREHGEDPREIAQWQWDVATHSQ